MQNNLEYTLFIRNFVENILLSLNLDYRKYISFNKENSILKTKLDWKGIDTTITHIAHNLLINGKQKIYLYDKDNKVVVLLSHYKNEKKIGEFTIRFPKNVMSTFKRKRILIKLKKMVFLQSDNYLDKNYTRDNLFILELMSKKSLKLTKEYVSVNTNMEKCTDQYILFREIRKRKYQRILVNYIFDELNKNFHKYLKICDKDDNINFISHSLKELDEVEKELLNNNKTVDQIIKILYPNRNKQK